MCWKLLQASLSAEAAKQENLMSKVVVVYHSGYGHTQRMAQSVAQGANAELLAIDADGNLPEGGWEQLAAADAIVFGAPAPK